MDSWKFQPVSLFKKITRYMLIFKLLSNTDRITITPGRETD